MYTTTFDTIPDDIIPLSPVTYRRGIHAEEGSKGIQSPAICLGDNDGPTLFLVNENVGSSIVFPGDMSSGKRKEYGDGGGSPQPTWLHHRLRHHTTPARHSKKPRNSP
ncbi:hypothetical protein Tco_1330512 [Tanacetum coccineum]